MKNYLFLLFTLFSFFGQSQYVLKGKVTDVSGEEIPGVRVYVENTTYGVATSYKGDYFIELSKKGDYQISFKMIGMKDTLVQINIQDKITTLNITLQETSLELGTVEIYADKIDIAKKVIGKVQENRKNWANQYENYTCYTYTKTSLEKDLNKDKISKKEQVDSIISGPSKMNFIESYSLTTFQQSNQFHEKIIAHHDYSEKVNNNVSASVNFSFGDDLVPQQYTPSNPYIFFEKTQDGDFDLYQNMIRLPKICENPITSPVGLNAFLNYKYVLNSVFFEDGLKIYDIAVSPKFSNDALFSGNIFIIDSIWVIKSFDLQINPAAMLMFRDFRIIQDFENIDGKWVPVRREYIYSINDMKHIISANTRVSHTNYQFNTNVNRKEIKNELMAYEKDAFDKDSSFWDEKRPIQLKEEELAFIKEQDSIDQFLKSEAYLDSIDSEYNKITFWDITLNGIGFRNRFKKQEIYFSSLLSSMNFFGVGGFRAGPSIYYSKEFKNSHKIAVDGKIDYGFLNKDVRGSLGVEYTYLPLRFGSFKIRGGDMYDMINNYESALGTFSRGNYVRNQFYEMSQRIEIVNGLYGRIGFNYSDRQSIVDMQLEEWSNKLFGELNQPKPFERYIVSIFEFQLMYRFKQKYIIKKNKKILIGTEFPEIRLTYKKGVPGLFNSEVNFDFIEISASDEIKLGNYGVTKWNFIGGSFLNKVDLRFIEHKFIRGSDLMFFSNPLTSHQMLDSTLNTPNPYIQAFAIHKFNGFIMNKIPLVKHLGLELVIGGSALIIQDINLAHFEGFAGLERKFRIRKQVFKIGVYCAAQDNNINASSLRFKLGFDFFNTYTNSWTY